MNPTLPLFTAQLERQLIRTPFTLPLLLFVLTAGVGLAASYDPRPALQRFVLLAAGAVLFFVLGFGLVLRPGAGRLYGWGLLLLGGLVALNGLGNGWPARWEGVLLLTLPFGVASVYEDARDGLWLVILSALLLGLVVAALLLAALRAAWIALFVATLVVGLVLWAVRPGRLRPERRTLALLAALVLLLAGAALLVTVVLTMDPGRVALYRNTLLLVRDYPWTGGGLDNFGLQYATYAHLLHVPFHNSAHQLYLDVAFAQGLPGLGVLLWLLVTFLRLLWQQARQGIITPSQTAAAVAVVTILLHGLVDSPLYISDGAGLLLGVLAFALPPDWSAATPWRSAPAYDRSAGTSARIPRRVWVALGLALFALALWWRPLLSSFYSNGAALVQSRLELSQYNLSAMNWPVQDAVRREMDLGKAQAGFEQALAWNADNVTAHRRLGMINLARENWTAALAHLQAAYNAAPAENATRQMLGEVLLATGQVAECEALWDTVDRGQGQLSLREAWYRYLGNTEMAELVHRYRER